MKRLLATLITLIVLSMAAMPAAAQTRTRCATRSTSTYNGRTRTQYQTPYSGVTQYRNDAYRVDANGNSVYVDANGNNVYYDDPAYTQNLSVWDNHRDKITTAGGAVGGALLGGLIGGKKGAVIGAITGGAGAAIYTYKIRDKNYRY